ncbi:MAG: hypothetical protein AAGH78_03595, partial [Cyanobacteria bacterium P01_H01_bin.58]
GCTGIQCRFAIALNDITLDLETGVRSQAIVVSWLLTIFQLTLLDFNTYSFAIVSEYSKL